MIVDIATNNDVGGVQTCPLAGKRSTLPHLIPPQFRADGLHDGEDHGRGCSVADPHGEEEGGRHETEH